MCWRRKWQPTPVFLPRESHGQQSLACYSPRGRKESDTTERLHFTSLYVLPSWLSGKKDLPAKQETQIWSLCQEDPLEKEIATHSRIRVLEIPWTEEPGGLQSMGS